MLKVKLVLILITAGFINIHCRAQTNDSTLAFAKSLKKLITLNSLHDGSIDLSGREAINLEANATTAQLIEITAPYLKSKITNAKKLCIFLLTGALFKKAKSLEQRQQIVEIVCKYYLTNSTEIQIIDNVLLQATEKDFNANAKKYIAALMDSVPKFSYGICAQLSAIAQVKESIPAIWKVVNRDITTMQGADIDVLASLARMGEKEAGVLLCNYYNSEWCKREKPGLLIKSYVRFAKQMAFSLDRTVLDCLISDFRNFDMTIKDNGVDYFWWPASYLGTQIAGMLKNYPYQKEFQFDPHQLLGWLNATSRYELADK